MIKAKYLSPEILYDTDVYNDVVILVNNLTNILEQKEN